MSAARKELNTWILERQAEGLWVLSCRAGCGTWFAQRHRGRPAFLCEKHRCTLWHRWREKNGRAPPGYMILKWRELYGDRPRGGAGRKRHPEVRF